MIKITTEQENLLKKHGMLVDSYNSIREFLIDLDKLILIEGLTVDGELNTEGIKLQRVYDQIYNQN